jgi:hypothetical protein
MMLLITFIINKNFMLNKAFKICNLQQLQSKNPEDKIKWKINYWDRKTEPKNH